MANKHSDEFFQWSKVPKADSAIYFNQGTGRYSTIIGDIDNVDFASVEEAEAYTKESLEDFDNE